MCTTEAVRIGFYPHAASLFALEIRDFGTQLSYICFKVYSKLECNAQLSSIFIWLQALLINTS